MKLVAAICAFALASVRVLGAAPPSETAHWGKEPVETLSAVRAVICLNGAWKFAPAAGEAAPAEEAAWGYAWVPGAWAMPKGGLPGVLRRGNGPAWEKFKGNQTDPSWEGLARAWYARPLRVPAEWKGRAILLDLRRVSTDARVFVNDRECGRVGWPGGEVDITAAVEPGGAEAQLRIEVAAVGKEGVERVFMGTAEGQIEFEKAKLAARGIIGDVLLTSRPAGARVNDVWVRTSTRRGEIEMDVELEGAPAGALSFTASIRDEKGAEEQRFTATAEPDAGVVRLKFPWPNPRLWDVEQPNLYTLLLRVEQPAPEGPFWKRWLGQTAPAQVLDEYAQPFGFREFWIEGRELFLNGSEVRFRPTVLHDAARFHQVEVLDNLIAGWRAAGFNLQEVWPENHFGRGTISFYDLWYARADRAGWPVIGSLGSMAGLAEKWHEPGARDDWEKAARAELRRMRNHPSILMWVHSANRFGNWDDQNPRRIGHGARLAEVKDKKQESVPAGLEATAFLKQLDPTRPVTTHQGGQVGDLHTCNHYPNYQPAQEQEEWLSEWVQSGDRPYLPVEFGPLSGCDFKRGRLPGGWGRGFGTAYTEHFTTEWIASVFGREAYAKESDQQRGVHARTLAKDQERDANGKALPKWLQGQYYLERPSWVTDPLTYEMLGQLTRGVNRAWRTMGTTAGMIWWEYDRNWERVNEEVEMAPFTPGQRGTYAAKLPKFRAQPFLGGHTTTRRSEMFLPSNQPTLAWICGAAEEGDHAAFTSKDHAFPAGGPMRKQIALLNDTRGAQPWQLTWRATLGGREIARGERTGELGIAETLFVPVEFPLPADVAGKTDGEIRLNATIGGAKHEDGFAFRAFPAPKPTGGSLSVFDPKGKTTAMLKALGYEARELAGGAGTTPALPLIVGREAGDFAPLEAFVREGGRALVFAPHPDWLRARGFRVGRHVSRRVFAVDPKHAVLNGLDDLDLRDWAGHSTLLEPRPAITEADKSASGYPKHGWHWGNRGGVSSAMVEKPHRSGWRPLLECDFDLQYSPLLELDYGRGRVTLCTLDLEDHFARDPAAAQLARNLIEHVRTAPLHPKPAQVIYAGGPEWERKLTELGAGIAKTVPPPGSLLIADPAVTANEAAVRQFANAGGRVLVLPARAGVLGARVEPVKDFVGSLEVPTWPFARGLSTSDLRARAPHEAWLVRGGEGVQVSAGGLLAGARVGRGEVIFCQFDPDRFDADKLTYFRFSRWRQTRAFSQVLGNLGVSFRQDAAFFQTGKATANAAGLYHADHLTEFPTADDPHRYYRW